MDLHAKQPDALQRIKEEAEKAKIASPAPSHDINLPFITADASGPQAHPEESHRAKMEQLTDSLFERTTPVPPACLKDAASTPARLTNSCSSVA